MNTDQSAKDPVRPTEKPDVVRLIQRGRNSRPPGWPALVLTLLTSVALWCAYPPLDLGPLAWVCLVPLLLVCRLPQPVSWQMAYMWLGAWMYWLITLQWMRLGDVLMYPAWLAHSMYLACYWPLFVWLTQIALQRFKVPLYVAAPIVWVGLEYLRGHLLTGFSWYLLGHSQHNWIGLIQISDLCGGYGVSFLVMMANAALAQLVPLSCLERFELLGTKRNEPETERGDVSAHQQWLGVIVSLILVAVSLGYGSVRRGHPEFETGPRVALIQGDFPATTKPLTPEEFSETYRVYDALTGQSVRYQPDVIVWPEAMFRYTLMEADPDLTEAELAALFPYAEPQAWRSGQVRDALLDMAQKTNAALILGIPALVASNDGVASYNSAVFVEPEAGISGRYDKIHLVPFGEYIPLVEYLPFLSTFTPYGADGGMRAGERIHVFEYSDWRFVPLICFEDTVPHLVRSMAAAGHRAGQDVDCFVNMSNDGWFHGSVEHDQHLITAAFRCIETRVPMVRAANMGISAFIDGDGVIREPEAIVDLDAKLAGEASRKTMRDPATGKFYRQLNWALISTVPLDPRSSLYVRWGDWFGMLMLTCCLGLALHALLTRKQRPQSTEA